jgi:nucleoside-diphosphate-sugar epimerase
MDKVSIIGLGWLGLPLAQALQSLEYEVTGSCTSSDKSQLLNEAGIPAYVWRGGSGIDLPAALCARTVIVTLPPSRCHDYLALLQQLLSQLLGAGCQHLVLISSTAIYGAEAAGSEVSAPQPDSIRGERMARAEDLVRSAGFAHWAIVRPAGLFGPGRHPGRFLSGQSTDDGSTPVNLVHQQDVVGILCQILQQQAWGQIFNACAPGHPSRREFYTRACERLGVMPPLFGDVAGKAKQIDGSKVERVLGYVYQIPDPLAWLSEQPEF